MVGRPTGTFELNPFKSQYFQVQYFDESVDDPNGVVFSNQVVQPLRKQRALVTALSLNMHKKMPATNAGIFSITGDFLHSLTGELLAVARECGLPIAYTRVVYADDGADAGVMCRKVPALATLTEDDPGSQVVEALVPRPGELIVRKTQPSAFFGTGLTGWLVDRRVDTVIVTGCTTSGCVRASVVDAMSHNFRTIVARDGVGDRAPGPHEANLFDMQQKYADVIDCAAIIAHLEQH